MLKKVFLVFLLSINTGNISAMTKKDYAKLCATGFALSGACLYCFGLKKHDQHLKHISKAPIFIGVCLAMYGWSAGLKKIFSK